MESGVVWLLHLGGLDFVYHPDRLLGGNGCFLKWWYPQNTPKMIIFSRKPPWLLGTTISGNPQMSSSFVGGKSAAFCFASADFPPKSPPVPLQKDSELAGKIPTWHVHPGFHSPNWSSISILPIPIFITIVKGDSREPPIMATPYMLSFPYNSHIFRGSHYLEVPKKKIPLTFLDVPGS